MNILKIGNDFSFTRKYEIKDLLSADTLLKDTAILEFDTFDNFASSCLVDKKIKLTKPKCIIVPVENKDEAKCLMSIRPEVRPYLMIYLKDFSKECRDEFNILKESSLICDSDKIVDLKSEMEKNPSTGFVEYMKNSVGVFRDKVNLDNSDDISYIYSDSFYTLPYFCMPYIEWDYSSFEDMAIKDINKILFHTNLIYKNVYSSTRAVRWDKYGSEGSTNYVYKYIDLGSSKNLYLKDGILYIDNPGSEIGVDLYSEEYKDANNIDLHVLDKLTAPFDARFELDVLPSLISVSQNIKCMGTPYMIPILCRIVSKTLNGGIL